MADLTAAGLTVAGLTVAGLTVAGLAEFGSPDDLASRLHPSRSVGSHEGAGSLLSLLKGRGWSDQLVAGETRSHSDFATFELSIELTEAGDDHVEEIVGHIFQVHSSLPRWLRATTEMAACHHRNSCVLP